MQFSTTPLEMQSLSNMTGDDRLNYCLSRFVETEEIWGLAETQGWIIHDTESVSTLPIWPYKDLATACAKDDWKLAKPQSISLEHFIYKVSEQLIENEIQLEVLPTDLAPGKIIPARSFFKMLENMMESGEYFMEG